MAGRNHKYIIFVITYVVLADCIIFIMAGRDHKYIIFLITYVVSANYMIFIMAGGTIST
jgi:hypothetical protein